jgi:myo-inositol-1(or 4)-monophosphatase
LEKHGKIIYELERRTSYFRRLGTAAIMLAYVAAGRTDAVILTGNKPWDTLAGIVLVREAGGKVTDYCGCRWHVEREDVVATNGAIHKHLVAITKKIKVTKCSKDCA